MNQTLTLTPHCAVPAAPCWTRELWLRARRLWLLKLTGITACTTLFFVAYFHVMRNPAFPVTLMPLTALDRWIPFQPLALFPYLTLWFYLGIAPSLQRGFMTLVVYGLWCSALCLAGLSFFYFWPTAVPPLLLDVSGFAGFALLQGVDAAGNACPSLHVAVSIFTAIRIEQLLRHVGAPAWLRALNGLWFLAIAWSTLAVKQHVALDAYAGALLGMVFAFASLRWRPRDTIAP